MRSLLLVVLLVSTADAHRPGGDIAETDIDDPTISWLVTGTFESGDEVFVLELDMPTDFALPFELLVEKRPALRDHRPMYAVVGPGLPQPAPEQRALLPEPIQPGWGAYVEENDAKERVVYFEQFMRRTSWTSGTIALPLERGVSQVWIWSPEGTTGDFQLGFGVEEDFSGGAVSAMLSDWGTYAY